MIDLEGLLGQEGDSVENSFDCDNDGLNKSIDSNSSSNHGLSNLNKNFLNKKGQDTPT